MSRDQMKPVLLLLAAAALTGPLVAQTRSQEPPKEPAKVERVKEAPKQVTPKAEAPSAETREIAKKAAHFEGLHRDRIARIDRLIAVYTAKGDREKVTELEALRESQMKRHGNAMEGFRKQIGPDAWGHLEKELKGSSARAQKARDEHANQNEKEREAKEESKEKEQSKDKPPARSGGKN